MNEKTRGSGLRAEGWGLWNKFAPEEGA